MAKRKYTVTEKVIEANRIKAAKPRRKFNADLRAIAREVLEPVLAGPGLAHVAALIKAGPSAEGFERYRWAMEFASGRIGLPESRHQDIAVSGALEQREVVVIRGEPGWLGVAGGAGDGSAGRGDHDGCDDQATVQ